MSAIPKAKSTCSGTATTIIQRVFRIAGQICWSVPNR
jgi:hypothetical protein